MNRLRTVPFTDLLFGEGSLIDWYLENCCTTNPRTQRNKHAVILALSRFLAERLQCHPLEIRTIEVSRRALEEYVSGRIARGNAPRTVNLHIEIIKHIWGSAYAEYDVPNIAAGIRFLRLDRPRFGGLTEEQAAVMLRAAYSCGKSHFSRHRTGALVELMLSTGLRPADVAGIKLRQLSPCLSWIRDVATKGRFTRRVYIPEEMRSRLADFLHYRAAALSTMRAISEVESRELALFPALLLASFDNPESFTLGRGALQYIVKLVEDRCGFKINARMFRHTFAHRVLRETKDIRLVAQALGHSQISTTMRYTERSDEELAEQIENAVRRKG